MVLHDPGELQDVERSRHVNVSEENPDLGASLKDEERVVRCGGLNDFEAGLLKHIHC
jgi:hypothetical protein